jgi:hypothetical protein
MREWGALRPQDLDIWESMANGASDAVELGRVHWPMIVKALISHIRAQAALAAVESKVAPRTDGSSSYSLTTPLSMP